MELIIFMLCLTLHNIEEALWLTDWQKKTLPNRRPRENKHFIFSVVVITVLGYLVAGLSALFPQQPMCKLVFVGFVGAMIINAIAPHLVLTIWYRKYCPGTFTGCFLILPFYTIILYHAINSDLSVNKILMATLVVGLLLLTAIPVSERLAQAYFASLDRASKVIKRTRRL